MKILLTHGYFLSEDERELKIMKPYPPLGILYISSYLKQRGILHDVYDTTFSDYTSFIAYLKKTKPGIIALYVNLVTKLNILKIIRFIRQDPTLRDTVIVLGGPDITFNIENYLQHGADYLVIGEGEQTFYELAQKLKSGNEAGGITGIAYKKGSVIHTNPPREKLKTLDELEMPNRQGINLHLYLDTWKKHHGKNSVSISTQRGCPYTCKWCSTAVYGQTYRRRSAKKVADEIAYIKEKYNPDTLWFVDDVFTISHKWIAELHMELTSRKLTIHFECITRAERLNDTVLRQMKEMGCYRIWIGAESGSQDIINAMDRRVNVEQVRDMILLAKKYSIETGTFLMLGYPGEKRKDIEETVSHLKSSNPDLYTITIAYPIKGTTLYNEVAPLIANQYNWSINTDRDIDFKRTFKRKYYEYALRYVVNEVGFSREMKKKNGLSAKALKHKLKSVAARTGMYLHRA